MELQLPLHTDSLLLLTPFGAAAGIAVTRWVEPHMPVLFQIAKFGLVGLLSTTIDLAALNVLMRTTGAFTGVEFAALKGVSFAVALSNAFLWNRHWTFRSDGGNEIQSPLHQFSLYATVAIGGLALNVTAATLFVTLLAPPSGWSPIQWANIGALSALVGTATWDFLCYKFIVFRRRHKET